MAPTQTENASKQKQVSAAREKVLKIKRSILKIVEDMLEEEISVDWFLQNCSKLCRGDYDDVIQERSIEHMCGYPLCPNPIKQITKQKFHISCTNNKVYELSERKCFCSNECYKASNFIKHQLSSLPLYMRKDSPSLNLLSEGENKGSAGEEVIFQEVLSEKEIETAASITPHPTNNFSKMLQEELKHCTESLEGLQIKEKIYEKPYIFEKQQKAPKHESLIESDEDDDYQFNDDSDEGDKDFFPEYDKAFLSQRTNASGKKAVLITPNKPCDKTTLLPAEVSREFIEKIFEDWMTEDTMKYLLGEREFYAAKADVLFQRVMSSDPKNTKKLISTKNEYIDLCLKLDNFPDDDCFEVECNVTDSAFLKTEKSSPEDAKNTPVDIKHTASIKTEDDTNVSEQSSEKSVNQNKQAKNKSRRKSKHKSKGVTFASDVKPPNSAATESRNSDKELDDTSHDPVVPLVESLSQNALRRQVVLEKLKPIYYDVLPIANFHYTDIRDSLKDILKTF
ncbi:putative RNA polymerase II subunit B1 CTD phosphatase RPAP2, partial [Uloborus diversus]|uniref:putative RNA polymerase II subunit B1 CTD phosphatase RPAP2 n=1 Tax=Uloborus diversus TaxID=327109 RepID=UPI0024093926